MSRLPPHGKVACARCHCGQPYSFDQTQTTESIWRITNNPLAWGSAEPEILVLGFSKGPTQAGALASQPHDQIAYSGGRASLAKILHHVRLIEKPSATIVDRLIADRNGRFHFGSLVRCTVERFDQKALSWTGTGGGMLDKFVATPFGNQIVGNCITQHMAQLPPRTRLIVLLGLGTGGNYVQACRTFIYRLLPGPWEQVNEVAYRNDKLTVVHTEHFKSQGALIPNWLSETAHPRGRLGLLAREAVQGAGVTLV